MRTASTTNIPRHSRGLTLIEVMVSMGIFALISLGVLSLVTQVRRIAENNVYENTAITMAQGYVEQVRSLSYSELLAAATYSATPPSPPAADPGVGSLRLFSANGGGNLLTNEAGRPLRRGNWARERVFLDRNSQNQDSQPMDFRFRVNLVNLNNATLLPIMPQGIEITIDYQFTLPDGRNRTITRSLRNVRSVVPNY
jgi:prepilin-type N-terminal cleavage/methylation domain-containing protein